MPAVGNSNCVQCVSRSMLTLQILPRFPFLASFVIWRGFYSRKQIFATPKKTSNAKCLFSLGGPITLCRFVSSYIRARWT